MLVVLRVAIGWHFLYAGIDKLTSPNFTAASYLGQAKGPLAPRFHELIPDWDGRDRFGAFETKVGEEKVPPAEHRATALKTTVGNITSVWDADLQRFVDHYTVTNEQQAAAKTALDRRREELTGWLAEKATDIEEYFHQLHRLEKAREAKDATVPFQQKRNWEAQTKLRGQLGSWSAEVDRIGNELRTDLRLSLTDDQAHRGAVPAPLESWFTQDKIVTYSNIAIGVCLMLGLFTRLAALGGALFLLTIVLSQPDWPGLYPPPPPSAGRTFLVGKEAIEMLALCTLATLPVGRWAGLDHFLYYLFLGRRAAARES